MPSPSQHPGEPQGQRLEQFTGLLPARPADQVPLDSGLVAAAVCPHPPLLVPEVAAGAAGELDGLRDACDAAVAHLLRAAPDVLLTVGAGPEPSGAEIGRPDVPLSLGVAAWLFERHGVSLSRLAGHTVHPGTSPEQCRALGRALAGPGRVALLVMGDGSACRSEKAPGYLDPRAEAFDASVAAALASADAAALLALDPDLAAELLCAGRAPWQVLAGAMDGPGDGDLAGAWTGHLTYAAAPYGVAYFVATLSRRAADDALSPAEERVADDALSPAAERVADDALFSVADGALFSARERG